MVAVVGITVSPGGHMGKVTTSLSSEGSVLMCQAVPQAPWWAQCRHRGDGSGSAVFAAPLLPWPLGCRFTARWRWAA